MKWDDASRVDTSMDQLFIQDLQRELARYRIHDQGKTHSDKTRKRGSKGGARVRLKRQGLRRVPLPSIILANVQSLRNKTDELQANVINQHKYRDACIMAFSETWLMPTDTDSDLTISGFGAPVRLDRDSGATGKSQGGGVCVYLNQRWCNNVTVRESICTADIELLSVSVRPFYIPREFPQLFLTVVYIYILKRTPKMLLILLRE